MNMQTNQTKTLPYYYLPKNLFVNKNFSSYSTSSKLLVGILISSSENSDVILETADLLKLLGNENIKKMLDELNNEKIKGGR